jgi:hypothetical protein
VRLVLEEQSDFQFDGSRYILQQKVASYHKFFLDEIHVFCYHTAQFLVSFHLFANKSTMSDSEFIDMPDAEDEVEETTESYEPMGMPEPESFQEDALT